MSQVASFISNLVSRMASWIAASTEGAGTSADWIMVPNTDSMIQKFNELVDGGMAPKDALTLVKATIPTKK